LVLLFLLAVSVFEKILVVLILVPFNSRRKLSLARAGQQSIPGGA
jgi:hypothetical protein